MFKTRCTRLGKIHFFRGFILGIFLSTTILMCFPFNRANQKMQYVENNTDAQRKERKDETSTRHTKSFMTKKETELPFKDYRRPLEIDMPNLVREYRERNGAVNVTPINEYPYKFVSAVPNKCKPGNSTYLVLLVKSAVRNFQRRAAIRETWGNQTYLNQFQIKVVFVLGSLSNVPVQKLITQELSQNGDIVQIDYMDSYYNNTLKTTGAIRWATRYCSKAKFFMMTDDDFHLAIDVLVKQLISYSNNVNNTLYMGFVGNDIPGRDPSDRWQIPLSVYPYNRYPPFVVSGGMILSMKVAIDLDIAIRFTKPFKFDDVFIGMVAYKLGIRPIHNSKLLNVRFNTTDKRFHSFLATHGYSVNEIKKLWKLHRHYIHNITRDYVHTTIRYRKI